jgi:ribosome biogenesis protein MAK21
MKSVVVREMVSLVFRPPASTHAAASRESSGQHVRFEEKPSKSDANLKKGKDNAPKPPRVNAHAAYYATITFNQIVLSPSAGDRTVARQLLDVYFELFKELLGSSGSESKKDHPDENELDHGSGRQTSAEPARPDKHTQSQGGFAEVEDSNSRHISAILAGVNRALPYAKLDSTDITYVSRNLHCFLH